MKYLVVLSLIAVASATYLPIQAAEQAKIHQIVQAISKPNADSAAFIALQNLLFQLLHIHFDPEPISVGPALVDAFEPISVGPTIVDDAVLAEVAALNPSPIQSSSSPLVQIIVNVKSQSQIAGNPAQFPTIPETVNVVDQAPETVNVVDQAPEVVNVVDQAPEAVNIVDQAPETVNVVQPILPEPIVNLPENLN